MSTLVVSLDNITMVLREAYKTLADNQLSDIVLAVGNTGCGKSTLFSALVFGPDALEEKRIEIPRLKQDGTPYVNRRGEPQVQRRTVIDRKEEY